jgi:menaquinone-9 beta-reductase
MTDVTDVVVVGAGIGGSALAGSLCRGGLGVTVLEATTEYLDRVRGEAMHVWGVQEARELGVEDVMLDAGAHISALWKQYAEGIGVAAEVSISMMLPGIPGTLNLRHPDACQALTDDAVTHGANVVRGVRDVTVTAGAAPTVSYAPDGARHDLGASWSWEPTDGRRPYVSKWASRWNDKRQSATSLAC